MMHIPMNAYFSGITYIYIYIYSQGEFHAISYMNTIIV